ncbi:Protein ALP1-like [Frankliniella fusca]|uniref:Protein ALP1-like n=1 Tax=Frankliniella fusca TaxID=407009 RepID=A0AAE1LH35_9NEOP|nr:Protein ALP1-like [Frankliniella fusca]
MQDFMQPQEYARTILCITMYNLCILWWILATPDTFRSVALRFGVSPGVLHCKEIIRVLANLTAETVYWPSERAILKEAGEQRTGFPGAVMAIDGSYIPLFYAPQVEPQRFLNRKFDYAVTLQACADINLVFRDVYCGEPGSPHDSRVFRRSPLSRRLLEQNILADDEHIIGDSAYIFTDKLNYNFRLSSLRSMVERAFGRLKMKWRRLFFLSTKRMDLVVQTIMASITLHNFIIYEGEIPDVELQHIQAEDNFGLEIEGDDLDDGNDYPNVRVEPDHPLLEEARLIGPK